MGGGMGRGGASQKLATSPQKGPKSEL